MSKKELRPERLTIIYDQREKLTLDLAPFKMEPGHLETGDYTVKGLEHLVAIERKSLPDLVSCCGYERERFERELRRLRTYQGAAVVYESSWADLLAGDWRSAIPAKAVMASINSWQVRYKIPFIPAGSRELAAGVVRDLLFYAARDAYRLLRSFDEALDAP